MELAESSQARIPVTLAKAGFAPLTPLHPVSRPPTTRLTGTSTAMRELRQLVSRVALSDSPVFITGESGVGKERVAEAIHAQSARRNRPFIVVNCAALPAVMIEAELFGPAGVLERAAGGTVLLDEIVDMPLELQARLLRALESGSIAAHDGMTSTGTRLMASSRHCPFQALKDGQLREDVYYRLAVLPVNVPPLRQRGNDVQLLMSDCLDALNRRYSTRKTISAALRQQFQAHEWPGNVRELVNAMERAYVLADHELGPISLEPVAKQQATEKECIALQVGTRLACAERILIESTLRHFNGNRQQTAAVLGCSLKTLYNKLQTYRLSAARQSA